MCRADVSWWKERKGGVRAKWRSLIKSCGSCSQKLLPYYRPVNVNIVKSLDKVALRAVCHGYNDVSIIASNMPILCQLLPQELFKLRLEEHMPICNRCQHKILLGVLRDYLCLQTPSIQSNSADSLAHLHHSYFARLIRPVEETGAFLLVAVPKDKLHDSRNPYVSFGSL